MQENADAGEAEALRPAEFAVDGHRIPRVGLPHFQLVDGGAGGEVCADEPGLFGIPAVGVLLGPFGAGMGLLMGRGASQ